VEQQPQPIVLEVPQAVGDPAELLGGEVLGLAPGVGAPGREVAEDLGPVKLIGWGLFVGLKPIQLKVVHARPPSLGAVALRALLGDR
jgi:hypothetical protein